MSHLKTVFSLEKRAVSFRINTLTSASQEIEEALDQASLSYTKLNFPNNSYVLSDTHRESDIWKRRVYKDWKIYMQGISSQIPAWLFSPNLSQFSPSQGEMKSQLRILDACAAPGGKTSQLSALYPDAEIVAFEPFKIRFEKMEHNLKKLWCQNVRAINDEIRNIGKYIEETAYFDLVLIDAPCSSEGWLSFHNEKFLANWDISHINKNYKRQKYIIDDTIPYLKDGWELIYTTCTIAPEENEWVTHYVLCNYPEMQLQNIDILNNKYINTSKALKSFGKHIYKSEISQKAIRVIPTEYSEWFYIAKFKKYNELST